MTATLVAVGLFVLLKPNENKRPLPATGQIPPPTVARQPIQGSNRIVGSITGNESRQPMEPAMETGPTRPAKDAPHNEQLAACIALAENGNERSIRLLLDHLMEETDGLVGVKLTPSLQAITNSAASGLLFQALTNEQTQGSLALALIDAIPRLATAELTRRMVTTCQGLTEDDHRRDWLLQMIGNVQGDGVSETCGTLLMSETNDAIQVSLAWALLRNGSTAAITSVIAKIESNGVTNTEDRLVQLLANATDGANLEFMVDVFDSTTNSTLKWAVGTAISRMQGFDRASN